MRIITLKSSRIRANRGLLKGCCERSSLTLWNCCVIHVLVGEIVTTSRNVPSVKNGVATLISSAECAVLGNQELPLPDISSDSTSVKESDRLLSSRLDRSEELRVNLMVLSEFLESEVRQAKTAHVRSESDTR